MTISDPLKEATQLLRDAIDNPGALRNVPPGRDAAIARVAEALRARGQAHRRQRVLRSPLLAAAVVLLVGGGAFAVHRSLRESASTADTSGGRNLGRLVDPTGAVTALRDGRSEPIGRGARLAEGTDLRTSGSAEASLDFDNGTHVTLGGASRVRLVEQTAHKRFALEAGSFSAKVAKLTADESFVVVTPDAEVEVRGTAFRVTVASGDPACEGGTPTRLEVSEGVVVVTHAGVAVRVRAGEQWPSCGASTATERPIAERAAPPVPRSATAAPAVGASATPTSVRPEASSRLGEQNDLFDEAMRLKRAGDRVGAVVKLDWLLADYPSGPLAESAAAERMRLYATSDPARALTAARAYLSRHPRGFARAEAEAIVAVAP